MTRPGSLKEHSGDDAVPPRHIHLSEAKIMSGSTTFDAGLWRGRLAAITGWSSVVPPRRFRYLAAQRKAAHAHTIRARVGATGAAAVVVQD